MPDPEAIEVAGYWAEEDARVYQLDPEPSAEWLAEFRRRAASRLTEVRPPFEVELATGQASVRVSGLTEDNEADVNELVQSLVKGTNERRLRDSRSLGG